MSEVKQVLIDDPDIAQHFLDWVRAGARDGEIFFNRRDALVHIVKEGALLVSPVSFKKFVRKHNLADCQKNGDAKSPPVNGVLSNLTGFRVKKTKHENHQELNDSSGYKNETIT